MTDTRRDLLREVKEKGLIYWEPNTTRGHERKAEMISRIDLALAAAQQPVPEDDWRNDPSADERWNAGCDYAMTALCKLLRINTDDVTWDAATEELEGDVLAVIGNILTVRFGDDWRKAAPQIETGKPIVMTYRNWRGEIGLRAIIPHCLWWGATEWHPEPGWLLTAWDCSKAEVRDFALADCQFTALPAPQPAQMDREALVDVIQAALWRCPDTGEAPDNAIADDLLAHGLRLPGGEETLALNVAAAYRKGREDSLKGLPKLADALGAYRREALRNKGVVEGGDDAA